MILGAIDEGLEVKALEANKSQYTIYSGVALPWVVRILRKNSFEVDLGVL
jgi:hypothetical protein